MISNLLRLLFGRIGPKVLALLALAAAWGLWWVWPQQPVAVVPVAFPGTYSLQMQISRDGQFALLSEVETEGGDDGRHRLIRLPAGEEILFIDQPPFRPRLLNGGKLCLFGHSDSFVLFDLARGVPLVEEARRCVGLTASDDGRSVAALLETPSPRILLVDSTSGRKLEIPCDADSDFELDSRGRLLIVTMHKKTSLVIYDVANGMELQRLAMPEGYSFGSSHVAPSGQRILTVSKSMAQRTELERRATLWDIATGQGRPLEPLAAPYALSPFMLGMFLNDRFAWTYSVSGFVIWDCSSDPPSMVHVEGCPWINSDGSRLIVWNDDGQSKQGVGLARWTLYDLNSWEEVKQETFQDVTSWKSAMLHLNGSANWFVVHCQRPRNALGQWIRKMTGRDLIETKWLEVASWKTGRITNHIPLHDGNFAGTTDDDFIWTFDRSYDPQIGERKLVLYKHRLGLHVPLWLHLLSPAVVLLILADWTLLRRHRVAV